MELQDHAATAATITVALIGRDVLTYAANLASIPQAPGHPRYAFARVDIGSAVELRSLFERFQPDAIMNLAAESHVDRSIDGPGEFIQTNVVGTFTLLQEALRYWRGMEAGRKPAFRFLHVSTDEVYGTLGADGMFTEATAYAPNSPYAASKASSDHLVRAWMATYGLPTIVTNCSNNYGPYQFPEKLIPHMIIKAIAGEALPVYGDGMNVRDWLYVGDHAKALMLVLARGRCGETYNIGSRNERTNIDVVRKICDLLERLEPAPAGSRRHLISHVGDRPGHDRRYAIDPTKVERELAWRAETDFETGLETTVRWFLDNRAWWRGILDRGYQALRVGML